MEYKIILIVGEFPSKYPDSKKYEFKVEGNPNKISAFSKFPMKVGDVISGDIVQNAQWYNFKWAKKETSAAQPLDVTNVLAAIAELKYLIQGLGDRLEKVLGSAEEVDKSGVPF